VSEVIRFDILKYPSNLPYNVYAHTATKVGTDIYLMGGITTGTTQINKNYKYNTLTNTWSQLEPVPYNVARHKAIVIGTDIFLMGGTSIGTTSINKNYKYDTLNNTWDIMTAMPYAVHYHTATLIDDDIYLMGGLINGSTISNTDFVMSTIFSLTPEEIALEKSNRLKSLYILLKELNFKI